jgi:hypothetical protein
MRRANFLGFRRGHSQRRGQQAVRQKAADAMDPTRCASSLADTHSDARWNTAINLRAVVSGIGQRQYGMCRSGRGGLTAPHFVMLSL